jgi:hypothetical protein
VTSSDSICVEGDATLVPTAGLSALAKELGAKLVGPAVPNGQEPSAGGVCQLQMLLDNLEPVDLAEWEPSYGRLAEAQVKWEAKHGRSLG